MAATNRDLKRDGPVERAAAAVPPPAGRAFRFMVVSLLAVSTGALVAVAILGGALISAPWPSLSLLSLAYLAAIPLAIRSYDKVKRRVARLAAAPSP